MMREETPLCPLRVTVRRPEEVEKGLEQPETLSERMSGLGGSNEQRERRGWALSGRKRNSCFRVSQAVKQAPNQVIFAPECKPHGLAVQPVRMRIAEAAKLCARNGMC